MCVFVCVWPWRWRYAAEALLAGAVAAEDAAGASYGEGARAQHHC